MNIYGNTSGESNVDAYEFGEDYIDVRFMDGSTYRYDHATTGKSNVDYMKRLAEQGFGLNGFISRFVKKAYASKS